MDAFFGVPTARLAAGAAAAAAAMLAALALCAWRWPVFLRLGVRQLPRRPPQTALIAAGLALSTALITAALGVGDTITHALRAAAVAELGRLDEVIVFADPSRPLPGGPLPGGADNPLAPSFFSAGEYHRLAEQLGAGAPGARDVAATTPAIWLRCTLLDLTSRQTSAAGVIALPPEYDRVFGDLVSPAGTRLALGDLRPGEVVLNDAAGTALGAAAGHDVGCTLAGVPLRWRVAAVAAPAGLGAGAAANVYLPLANLQAALAPVAPDGVPDPINQIWIANHGDAITSANRTDRVLAALGPLLAEGPALAELQDLLTRPDLRAALAARRGTFAPRTEANLDRLLTLIDARQPPARLVRPLGNQGVRAALVAAARDVGPPELVDAVRSALRRTVGFQVQPLKRQALELAERAGNVITTIFLLFALLSIAAGLVLVYLIFSLLAAARRSELGIARALGTERGHLVAMFAYEGLAYALLATAVGVPAGLGITRLLVALLIHGVHTGTAGFTGAAAHIAETVTWYVEPRSVVLAAALGLVVTLATVAASAWRVSRVTIVTAIRDLPEPPARRSTWRTWWWAGLGTAGAALVALGLRAGQTFPFGAGVSALLLAAALGLRAGVRWWACRRGGRLSRQRADQLAGRVGATAAGLGLAAYWALPFDAQQRLGLPRLASGIEIFGVAGLLMVAGTVWALMANADVVLGAFSRLVRRLGLPLPAVRLAAAYVLRNPLRTGLTTTMFALVVFALTVMQVITAAALHFHGDPLVAYGGWQLQGQTSAPPGAPPSAPASEAPPAPAGHTDGGGTAPPPDAGAASRTMERPPGLAAPSPAGAAAAAAPAPAPDAVAAAAAGRPELQAFVGAAGVRTAAFFPVVQLDAPAPAWAGYTVAAVDEGFAAANAIPLQARAPAFATDREAWAAVVRADDLAIVDGYALPSPALRGRPAASASTFRLHSVRDQQAVMAPVAVWVGNPSGGTARKLSVVGVIDRRAASLFRGLHVSRAALDALGPPIRPPTTQLYFRLRPGVDVGEARAALGAAFFEVGLQTTDLGQRFVNQTGPLLLASRMLQLFVGLGLVVGLAALGVISTRAALERRQAIGVLRAIGYSRGLVRTSLVLESAAVALIASAVGVGLGLLLCRNVFAVQFFDRFQQGLRMVVPWEQLALTAALTCAAAVAATWLPASHAARIPPIAALREE